MNKTLFALATTMALAASSTAHATSTATLKVAGRIAQPACAVSFRGSNTLSLGDLRTDSLNKEKPTRLKPAYATLAVSCSAAARYAFTVLDDAAGTVNPLAVPVADPGAQAVHGFGLGASTKEGRAVNTGAYVVSLADGIAGSVIVHSPMIQSKDGSSWEVASRLIPDGATKTAWTASRAEAGEPASVDQSFVLLTLNAAVIGTDALDAVSELALAGKITFELEYL